ncbi:Bifunctional homocysteine S-methyltransferase/5,10-methylenetetrahydrofolate reductase [Methanimicrococcus sp. At1]|uniref:Bifunctional homocysteine S-methyltransferase/5,10-methylenetetrahydrofolate reductase n=1 Tax=Methanimicrococcus hacksteinii TaxID=3028293 RepID=A0ABU3VRW0_9EURY|nr:methylenetetrahydrofolate reductase [Methanimicrococcus sp. At1]MDV0446019.1 Bifunctional homocysteine S-methyltransferase/5,10-methylenetetrahydrofolate reductase [Methanimicrococcus sp. At1]
MASKAIPKTIISKNEVHMGSKSTFKEKLKTPQFLVTGEVSPPKGVDFSPAIENMKMIQGFVDAINVTDNQCATLHMSSLAFARLMIENGYSEPVMQLTCRDRNRIGLQADLLGAAALGIPNLLVMSGDHPKCGDHPTAKAVYDLDSVQLLKTISQLKKGYDFSGNSLSGTPDFCVGVVSNADPNERLQIMKLEKKLSFDVDFIQTQAIFDIEKFKEFLEKVDTDVPIIAGIIPIRSVQMARYMDNNIPGISIPSEIHERVAASADPVAEGMTIAAELIEQLKPVCRGVHMMPVGAHTYTEKILKQANILE